jgi:polysaccharide export outer membrane protein
MKLYSVLVLLLLAFVAVSVSGCFSARDEDMKAFTKPSQMDKSMDKYILQPPDSVEVHCSEVPELNLQSQRIRPDGKISFERVGEMLAAGKTPSQLAEDIRLKVGPLYNLSGERPVDVRVVVYQSKSYYVVGQVVQQGAKNFTGRDTVLDAIAKAVPTNFAWTDKIQIIRPSPEVGVRPKIYRMDYYRLSVHGDSTRDMLLSEGDIIYVPPTILAWIGLKVDELLCPIYRSAITASAVNTAGNGGTGGGTGF